MRSSRGAGHRGRREGGPGRAGLAERRRQVGDSLGDRRGLVLLQKVLRGENHRVIRAEDALGDAQVFESESRITNAGSVAVDGRHLVATVRIAIPRCAPNTSRAGPRAGTVATASRIRIHRSPSLRR